MIPPPQRAPTLSCPRHQDRSLSSTAPTRRSRRARRARGPSQPADAIERRCSDDSTLGLQAARALVRRWPPRRKSPIPARFDPGSVAKCVRANDELDRTDDRRWRHRLVPRQRRPGRTVGPVSSLRTGGHWNWRTAANLQEVSCHDTQCRAMEDVGLSSTTHAGRTLEVDTRTWPIRTRERRVP
jgi:hypothetical protein